MKDIEKQFTKAFVLFTPYGGLYNRCTSVYTEIVEGDDDDDDDDDHVFSSGSWQRQLTKEKVTRDKW